jgi:hypothetical protein
MFAFLKRQKNQAAKLEYRDAILQGQITALSAMVGALIRQLSDTQREGFLLGLKGVLAEGALGSPEWPDETKKQFYKDAYSAVIMSIIESLEVANDPATSTVKSSKV